MDNFDPTRGDWEKTFRAVLALPRRALHDDIPHQELDIGLCPIDNAKRCSTRK